MTVRNQPGDEPAESDRTHVVVGPAAHSFAADPGKYMYGADRRPIRLDQDEANDNELFLLPGDRFFHFQIVEEIGHGSFARVYLAKQESLAQRLVVLKIATQTSDEPQKLARLQHANIVPVYSVHALTNAEAICMPYLGRITLDQLMVAFAKGISKRTANGRELLSEAFEDTLDHADSHTTLASMSLIETALWIMSQLAGGLAHAHRRGILHCDLKPANILISTDAVPMLLDFNVSFASGLQSSSDRIGGTYPYMSPEHLQAFDGDEVRVDERSDLYSLGVILYELLTGRRPHPFTPDVEPREAARARLIAQRQILPPKPSTINPAITPSVDAIVLKLLDPAPERRYRSADDLHEDLTRQLAHLPLRFAASGSIRERAWKWRKRNPRLSTGLAVGAIALFALVLPAGIIAGQQVRKVERAAELQKAEAINGYMTASKEAEAAAVLLSSRADPAMRAQGYAFSQQLLERYGVGHNAEWEAQPGVALLAAEQRADLKANFGELLILMTRVEIQHQGPDGVTAGLRWNHLAESMFAESERPATIDRQRRELDRRQSGTDLPAEVPAESPRDADLYFDGLDHAIAGRSRDALLLLTRFCNRHPDHFQAWFARGICHDALGQSADALTAFAVCVSLHPDFAHAYLNRGLAQLKLRRYNEADVDFTRALDLKAHWLPALINRGIARDGQRKPRDAEADYTQALANAACPTRVWFLRARARRAHGDQAGHTADRVKGMESEPGDAHSYRTRGTWRIESREFDKAIADFDAALKLHAGDVDALLNKGIVLADHLNREADAIPVFDRLLELVPDHVDARCSRGVYHARLGHAAEARRDADDALKADSSAYRLFQVAGLFAQLSKVEPKAKDDAIRYLARALRAGFNNPALFNGDHDLDPIRKEPAVVKLLAAASQVEVQGR
ncbi:MAG TPA: protein kinase [Gemmataceae bacterium]|jgi:serine/threonine protein kinase/Flp pilus assembly protein TadD|nr:protein kinase [Gemmataceae bacterium]